MKTLTGLLVCIVVLLAGRPPLRAQEPATGHPSVQSVAQVLNRLGHPGSPTGMSPTQYKEAYGFNRIPNQGQGQTIAIVNPDDDPDIESDLGFYASYFHLAPCNLQKVKVGNPAVNQGSALGASVGAEQICALAPQANIILVEANSDTLSDMLQAVAVASSSPHNATVVAVIYATEEFAGEQQFDSYFCGVHNGDNQAVTFLAPSTGCSLGVYPAASPCVLAVGGTTLALSTPLPLPNPLASDYGRESVWNGGLVSRYEPQPTWQNQACSPYSSTNRCTPDIVANASLNTGVAVYDTYQGGWVEVGGTSISTSDWAALITIVNSVRASQGHSTLSEAASDLYAIYNSSEYSNDFHDITSSGNGCVAGDGYDLGSGIGSYQTNNLYSTLSAKPN